MMFDCGLKLNIVGKRNIYLLLDFQTDIKETSIIQSIGGESFREIWSDS